jgi:hypothetical protein
MLHMPDDFEEVVICDALHLSYTELQAQPEEWIQKYLIYLEAKAKAEEAKMQKGNKGTSS